MNDSTSQDAHQSHYIYAFVIRLLVSSVTAGGEHLIVRHYRDCIISYSRLLPPTIVRSVKNTMALMLLLQTDRISIQRDNLPPPPASGPPLGSVVVVFFLLLDST